MTHTWSLIYLERCLVNKVPVARDLLADEPRGTLLLGLRLKGSSCDNIETSSLTEKLKLNSEFPLPPVEYILFKWARPTQLVGVDDYYVYKNEMEIG